MSKQEEETDEDLDERDEDEEEETDEDDGVEEEDDEDEDEDEDEDVEDEPAAAHPAHRRAPAPPPPAEDAEDPTWWLPHAVLATLVLLGVAGFFGAFSGIVKSPLAKASASAMASASAAAPAAPPPPQPRPTVTPRPRPTMDPNDPVFSAKQILVQYKGAAKSKQTRSKEEAKKRADEALGKLKGGAKFEDVVKDYSDEEGAAQRGGLLGRFKRGVLPPPVQAALEKTATGKNTDVVESELGFHILLRVQ